MSKKEKPNTTTVNDNAARQENEDSQPPQLEFVEEPCGIPADKGWGYLQVEFGERIGPEGRYEILRKLGWGMYSSVWLAKDLVFVIFFVLLCVLVFVPSPTKLMYELKFPATAPTASSPSKL